jgi:DNA-binding CsgD family transcriptional regulator
MLPLLVREAAVAVLVVDGHTAEGIAVVLGLSTETVRAYLARVRLKYENADRAPGDTPALRSRLIEDGYLEG